jgi:hypothetical protein
MVIHDQTTYREMREYINIDGIEMGPASADGHDDTVMALGIAFITTITENPVNFEAIYGMGRLARDQTMSETPSGDQMPSSLELVTAYGEID